MCLIMKIFGVHVSSIFCVFFFIFCVHFLHFLLPPIVKVHVSDIAIISVIPDMVKAIISGITNTPQKTYRCPINRFLESVTSLSPQPEVLAGKWRHHQSSVQLEASPFIALHDRFSVTHHIEYH
jgi:hypothetical protein